MVIHEDGTVTYQSASVYEADDEEEQYEPANIEYIMTQDRENATPEQYMPVENLPPHNVGDYTAFSKIAGAVLSDSIIKSYQSALR